MEAAIKEAQKAYDKGEIPIGAVIVKNGEIIAKAHNTREKSSNALAHAECEAIKKACKKLGDWRLEGCSLYVTLEPCMMCMGAIKNAHIGELVYGAYDTKEGFCDSRYSVSSSGGFCPAVFSGIKEEKCSLLIENFFKEVRENRR